MLTSLLYFNNKPYYYSIRFTYSILDSINKTRTIEINKNITVFNKIAENSKYLDIFCTQVTV